jgi:hypothetical protein
MEFKLALKDSEEGIKLDPNFRKLKKTSFQIKNQQFF